MSVASTGPLDPFHGAIAVPSVTRCRCCCCRRCRGHRCAGGVQRATVATPGEWRVRRLAVANGPNIFQMLLAFLNKLNDIVKRLFYQLRQRGGSVR